MTNLSNLKGIFTLAMLLIVGNAFASRVTELTNKSFEDKSTGVVFELDYEHRTATLVDGSEVNVADYVVPSELSKNGVTYAVTAIGDMAFFQCENLKSITLPKSVETIGNEAFEYCTLGYIMLSDGLKNIGTLAFAESDLVSIVIPASVKCIGDYAFDYCSDLASVIMDTGISELGSNAFANCCKLSLAAIPSCDNEKECFDTKAVTCAF